MKKQTQEVLLSHNDGTKMFIVGTTGDDVNEYTLSTGFDLSSSYPFVDSYSVSPKEAQFQRQ